MFTEVNSNYSQSYYTLPAPLVASLKRRFIGSKVESRTQFLIMSRGSYGMRSFDVMGILALISRGMSLVILFYQLL